MVMKVVNAVKVTMLGKLVLPIGTAARPEKAQTQDML